MARMCSTLAYEPGCEEEANGVDLNRMLKNECDGPDVSYLSQPTWHWEIVLWRIDPYVKVSPSVIDVAQFSDQTDCGH